MRGAEYDVFWQEHQAAAKNVYVSIRALVALIDNSAPDSDSIWLIGAPAKLFERPWNITKKSTDVQADPVAFSSPSVIL
jgi:hypothetical protein